MTIKSLKSVICILLIFTILITGLPLLHNQVYAKSAWSTPVEKIFFYATNSEGKDILLKIDDLDNFVDMPYDRRLHSFSTIDNYPTTVHTEARGPELPQVVDYIRSITDVKGTESIEFTDGGIMKFWSTDNWYTPINYEDISGYYYPNLYSNWEGGWHGVTDLEAAKEGAVKKNVILGLVSFQSRIFVDDELSRRLESGERMDGSFESRIDDERIPRICIPQQPEYLEGRVTASTNNNSKWTYRMLLDMGEGNRPDISAGEVGEPYYTITEKKNDSNVVEIELKCDVDDAEIYYSTDGHEPQEIYKEPFIMVKGQEIKFKIHATKVGYSDAGVVERNYPLKGPKLDRDETNNNVGNDVELNYEVDDLSKKWINNFEKIQYDKGDDNFIDIETSKYDISKLGTIKLDKSLFVEGVSGYNIKVVNSGYSDIKIRQTVWNTPPKVIADTTGNDVNKDIVLIIEENDEWLKDLVCYVNGTGFANLIDKEHIDKSEPGKLIIKSSANKFTKPGEYKIILNQVHGSRFPGVEVTQTIRKGPFVSEKIEFDRASSKKISSKEPQLENKDWTIRFNKNVKSGSYLQKNIVVVDKDNKSQDVSVVIGEDLKTIKILSPEKGYKPGEDYTIVIKDIESEDGKIIDQLTIMDFSIK